MVDCPDNGPYPWEAEPIITPVCGARAVLKGRAEDLVCHLAPPKHAREHVCIVGNDVYRWNSR